MGRCLLRVGLRWSENRGNWTRWCYDLVILDIELLLVKSGRLSLRLVGGQPFQRFLIWSFFSNRLNSFIQRPPILWEARAYFQFVLDVESRNITVTQILVKDVVDITYGFLLGSGTERIFLPPVIDS